MGEALVQLIVFNPESDFILEPWIGETINSNLSNNKVIIGNGINSDIGDIVTFYGENLKVVGRLEKTGMGYDHCIFMNFDTADKLRKSETHVISTVYLDIDEKYEEEEVVAAIEEQLNEKLSVVKTSSMFGEVSKSLENFTIYASLFQVIMYLSILVSLIIVCSVVVGERKQEFEILNLLGVSKKEKISIVTIEMLIICILGSIAGISFSIALCLLFENYFKLIFELPYILVADFDFLQQVLLTANYECASWINSIFIGKYDDR